MFFLNFKKIKSLPPFSLKKRMKNTTDVARKKSAPEFSITPSSLVNDTISDSLHTKKIRTLRKREARSKDRNIFMSRFIWLAPYKRNDRSIAPCSGHSRPSFFGCPVSFRIAGIADVFPGLSTVEKPQPLGGTRSMMPHPFRADRTVIHEYRRRIGGKRRGVIVHTP